MRKAIGFVFTLLAVGILNAQSIDIKGVVKDSASGAVVPGVVVTLLHAKISDTINHDGTFHLLQATTSIDVTRSLAGDVGPTVNGRGYLSFGVTNRERITVSTTTLRGKLMSHMSKYTEPGMQSLRLPQAGAEILLHRVSIGHTSYVLKTSGAGQTGSLDFGTEPETVTGLQSALAKQAKAGFRDTLVVVLNGKEVTRREILNPHISHLEIEANFYFKIQYVSNGSTGGAVPEIQRKTLGVNLPLATNTGDLVRDGYSFAGWNTSSDGNGTDYPAGADYSMEGNLTLYAKWKTLDTNAMMLVYDVRFRDIYNDEEGAHEWERVVTLPLIGDVDVVVDWGDGSSEVFTTPGAKTHTYAGFGVYTVSISGTLSGFGWETEELDKMKYLVTHSSIGTSGYFGSMHRLARVSSYGKLGLTSLQGAFAHAYNLVEVPAELPETITNLGSLFEYSDCNVDIGGWDVKSVTDMSSMFGHSFSFNQDISGWDVGNVTNMSAMFFNASAFNQDIGGWDVGKVTNMSSMFSRAESFNQDIGGWDVGKVTNMSSMFSRAESFNQDIGGWNVGKVTNMYFMFGEATSFNQDIGGWNVENVTDMSGMFSNAKSFNQDIGGWNVGNVTEMWNMFSHATSFNQEIGEWNVGSVITMNGMFEFAANFNQDISKWNTSKVEGMWVMFKGSIAFNQDLSNWCVTKVKTEIQRGRQSEDIALHFDNGATSWTLPNSRPVWGTCPSGEGLEKRSKVVAK